MSTIDPVRTLRRGAAILSGLLLLSGCATSDFDPDRVRAAGPEVPDRFLVADPGGGAPRQPVAGEGCRSPLFDPRDGTQLRMVRSDRHQADYTVPAGRYGVGARELLRVECGSGKAVGVVTR